MKYFKEQLNVAILDLEGQEPTRGIIEQSVSAAQSDLAGVWHLELIIGPEIARVHQELLDEFGFNISGTLTKDARTVLILRKNLKRSADGARGSFSPAGKVNIVRGPIDCGTFV
jgi:hypothetical protein